MQRKLTMSTARVWFWQRVDRTGRCWEWASCRTSQGYGRVFIDGTNRPAHRVAWTLAYGAIPSGLFVCHKCDNPRCVRPSHLFLGSALDNNRDKIAKGRAPHRDRHGRARVTSAQVADIRSRYAAGGISQERLAAEYGISKGAVWYILHGITWAVDMPA